MRAHLISFIIAGAFATIVALPWAFAITGESAEGTASFLQKVTEGQQTEIVLARLALRNAANEQVKAFGALMIQDHQRANQEVRFLAFKEDVHLVTQLSEQAIYQKAQLSRLNGTDFDQAYMAMMLRNHAKAIQEFEGQTSTAQDNEVRQWAADSVPLLKEHLERAKTLASVLGIEPSQLQ
jgi:putative membrane protein